MTRRETFRWHTGLVDSYENGWVLSSFAHAISKIRCQGRPDRENRNFRRFEARSLPGGISICECIMTINSIIINTVYPEPSVGLPGCCQERQEPGTRPFPRKESLWAGYLGTLFLDLVVKMSLLGKRGVELNQSPMLGNPK